MIAENSNLDTSKAHQLDLIDDYGQHALKTKLAALNKERAPRILQILELVQRSGRVGMTRDEIAVALNIAPTSPCSPCLALLRDGELIETPARRLTRFGSSAAVMVHRDYRIEGGE